MVVGTLYQSAIILNHFEGLNLSLTALKISDLEQLNNEIFALLSTRFYCLKIDYLIKRIGITRNDYEFYSRLPHFYCFIYADSNHLETGCSCSALYEITKGDRWYCRHDWND